jgi:aromatic-L-amino-acid/L-tryptophan decarboxylase
VVCFRYVGGSGDLDELNREILGRVIRRERVYISNAFIDRKFALRACIVNHGTTGDDVKLIVSEVLAAAREAGA